MTPAEKYALDQMRRWARATELHNIAEETGRDLDAAEAQYRDALSRVECAALDLLAEERATERGAA